MKLPTEEKNVLDVLRRAKGKPVRVVEISKQLGIQHNHCSKLIKFLTDKGYNIYRDYVVVDGKKKSYKEYWIKTELQTRIEEIENIRDDYPENHPERTKINTQIDKLRS